MDYMARRVFDSGHDKRYRPNATFQKQILFAGAQIILIQILFVQRGTSAGATKSRGPDGQPLLAFCMSCRHQFV